MKRSRDVPELLAPAGSPDALAVAIEAGADAVYLGGKRFGARRYAGNFDRNELEDALSYAHLRGVKVYVTVNTLILEKEVPQVTEYLIWLYDLGVDAVLVQDLGVVSLARDLVPGLNLHASTQMTVHNREGAAWAAGLGLKRAVLARELTFAEVEDIARSVPIGVEIFVHGALCYCYSGQCLLSSSIGGRSGNRGMCAQPCRKPYDLVRGGVDLYGRPLGLEKVPTHGDYLMSTRDLALYPHLDRIVDVPIEAVKIEGRMRSPRYTAVVVSIYRKALDAISRDDWEPSEEDMRDLALVFNRGFTPGYLMGARGDKIMGRKMPGNRGILVGTVVSYDPIRGEALTKPVGDLLPRQGDGLVFRSPGGEEGMVMRSSPRVHDGLMRLRVRGVEKGAQVWLTSVRTAKGAASRPEQFIPLEVRMTWDDGWPVLEGKMTGPHGGTVEVRVRGRSRMVPARNRPLSREEIETHIRKTGGTPFAVRTLVMEYPGGLFAPLSELNRLRRDLLEEAEAKLIAAYRPSSKTAKADRGRWERSVRERYARPISSPPTISVYVHSLETLRGAVDGGCQRIYFEPTWMDHREVHDLIEEAMDICRLRGVELIWKWPRITRRRRLDLASEVLRSSRIDEVMVEGTGAAQAARSARPDIRLSGGLGLNVWNSQTVRMLAPAFDMLTLSPELSGEEMADLIKRTCSLEDRPRMEVIVQGNLETCITEDRLVGAALGGPVTEEAGEVFWGIRDATGRTFPLWQDGDGRTRILNSVETSLVNHLPRLLQIGIDSLAIDARRRTERYAREMTAIYREATLAAKGGEKKDLERLREEARSRSLGGITAGAFVRGRKE